MQFPIANVIKSSSNRSIRSSESFFNSPSGTDSIDEVADPDKWLKANPNLGKTVSYETYQLDVERAEKAPAARNDILAKRFGLPMEGYTYYFTYEETLLHRHR